MASAPSPSQKAYVWALCVFPRRAVYGHCVGTVWAGVGHCELRLFAKRVRTMLLNRPMRGTKERYAQEVQ